MTPQQQRRAPFGGDGTLLRLAMGFVAMAGFAAAGLVRLWVDLPAAFYLVLVAASVGALALAVMLSDDPE